MAKDTLTTKDLRIVAELTAQGWPLTSIGQLLGEGIESLRRRIADDELLAAAIQEGRDRQEQALVNSLYQRAINLKDRQGHVCAMFLLKCRFNYVDRGEGAAGEASRVNVVVNIPAPLQPDQYRQLLAAHPEAAEDREPAHIDTTAEVIR